METRTEVPNSAQEQYGERAIPRDRGDNAPLPTQGRDLALPAGVRVPVFDGPKFERFARRIFSLPKFYDDRYGTPQGFARIIADPRTIILELGNENGYALLEQVEANGYGLAHIVVFNRRALPQLESTIDALINWAFKVFNLAVIAAWVPETNEAAISLMRRLGWNMDGLLRGIMIQSGKRVGVLVYSITRDEAAHVDGK